MEFIIKQDTPSIFGVQYIVYQGNEEVYRFRKELFTTSPKFVITDYHSGKIIGKIKGVFLSDNAEAYISISCGEFEFKQKKYNEMAYYVSELTNNNSTFVIYGHRGFTCSLYKNEKQIGVWNKNFNLTWDGDVYEIYLDDGIDTLLVASMAIWYNFIRSNFTIANLDTGNIGIEVKEYNPDWEPE